MEDNTTHADETSESPRRRRHSPMIQAALDEQIDKAEKNAAMLACMADLHYPESKDGSVLDLSFFKTIVAWHLVRCGWRPPEMAPAKRMIKPRRLVAKGIVSDAVEWVGVDEPDVIDYSSLTMAEIRALPPRQRAIAMRAMGGPEEPALPDNPGWHVQTNINIQDAPDPNDDQYAWTGRKYRK